MDKFKYLGVLVTREGEMERETMRQNGVLSAVMWMFKAVCCGEERTEPDCKVLHVQVNLCPKYQIWL